MDADFFRLRNYSAAKFAFSCSGNNWVGICDTVQCCPILTGICDTVQSRWYSSVSEILGCLLNCPMMMMILTGISDTYRTVDVILVGINDNLVPAELSSASDATYRCLRFYYYYAISIYLICFASGSTARHVFSYDCLSLINYRC